MFIYKMQGSKNKIVLRWGKETDSLDSPDLCDPSRFCATVLATWLELDLQGVYFKEVLQLTLELSPGFLHNYDA